MERPTPQAIFDLYVLLSNNDKVAFQNLLARISTAESIFLLAKELPITELGRFSDMMFQEITWHLFPILEREARRLAREKPELSEEEFDKEFHERIKQSTELYNREVAELEGAKLKEQRDRKSDPEIVHRNVEICDHRRQDRKRWSIGKLAKTYDLSHRAITLILRDEEKWRRLAQKNAH